MRLRSGITLLFLSFIGISLVGCCTPEVRTEYIYQAPIVTKPLPTELPDVSIKKNEDLVEYKEQCKVKIKQCNIDKVRLYNESQGKVEYAE